MSLREELYKIYRTVEPNAVMTVRCRRHPSHLRIVAKARHLQITRAGKMGQLAQHNYDSLVYRNYMD